MRFRNSTSSTLGALACLGLLAAACDSSGQTCLAVAWWNHLEVRFTTPDREDAVYDVKVKGGALDVHCQLHVSEEAFEKGADQLEPDDAPSDGGARFIQCDRRQGLSSGVQPDPWRMRRADDGFEVELAFSMPMDTAPARVRIEMLRGETVLVDRRIRPDYTVTEPAGPGCGLKKDADIQLALDN